MNRTKYIAAVGALTLGATGVAFATATSSSATPTVIGTCTGMRGLAKVTGLTNTNGAATVSTKNVLNVGGTVGACTYNGPVVGVGTKQMTKWSSKTTSPAADCINDVDPTEYALNGKSSTTFSDGSKSDVYIAGAGRKPGSNAVQRLSGIVVKGAAAGAFVDQEIWTIPVIKDKAQTLEWNGTPDLLGPLYPSYSLDIANGLGCQDATGLTAANLTGLLVGTGQSEAYAGDTASGTTLTLGV